MNLYFHSQYCKIFLITLHYSKKDFPNVFHSALSFICYIHNRHEVNQKSDFSLLTEDTLIVPLQYTSLSPFHTKLP